MRFVSASLGDRDRSGFSSGSERLDDYFHHRVGQDIRRNYVKCHVLLERDTDLIAGFHTLSATAISLQDLPNETIRKLPRYDKVPSVLIGWMARDLRFQREQIGRMLLVDIVRRVLASDVAAFAIVTDAIDEAAERFYERHGFRRVDGRRFFLTVGTARTAIEGL